MTWMLTINGREHHLSGQAQMFNLPHIEDIAHALALINRFTGHTERPYSVAEHSLLVADIAAAHGASPSAQLAALLHDAHEAYTSDVSSPAKWAIGQPWEVFEHSQAARVHAALGVRSAMAAHRADIRRWDLMALATERRDLTCYDPARHAPWAILDTPGQEVLPLEHVFLDVDWRRLQSWEQWREDFLDKYRNLVAVCQGGAA